MTIYRKPINAEVGQGFNVNRPLYQMLGQLGHNGLDFPAAEGTPVRAARAGTVVHAGWGVDNPLLTHHAGISVLIDHGDCLTGYAHLSSLKVKAGDKVKASQLLGGVGKTGSAGDYHLHFEYLPKPFNFGNGFAGRATPPAFTPYAKEAK